MCIRDRSTPYWYGIHASVFAVYTFFYTCPGCSFGYSTTVNEASMTLHDESPYVDVRGYHTVHGQQTCTTKLSSVTIIIMHVYTQQKKQFHVWQ